MQIKIKQQKQNAKCTQKWRQANRERVNANARKWYQANKEKVKVQREPWRIRNKEKLYAKSRAWAEKNKERYKYLVRRHKWWYNYGLSEQNILTLLKKQKDLCAICRDSITVLSCSIDHIVAKSIGGKNKKKNIQLTCRPCNVGKWTMSTLQYIQHCIKIAKAQKSI